MYNAQARFRAPIAFGGNIMATRKTTTKRTTKRTTKQAAKAADARTAAEVKAADPDKAAAKKNSDAAARRTTTGKGDNASARANTSTEGTDKFGNADTETQKSAAGSAQLAVATGQMGTAGAGTAAAQAVSKRVDKVGSALHKRDQLVKQARGEEQRTENAAQREQVQIMAELEPAARAPLTNPMQKPLEPGQVGIHPDVTSPTNLYAQQTPSLPGTGVADPRDLAPGQDLSPSPPVSSSNILPQPDKPGDDFSKL